MHICLSLSQPPSAAHRWRSRGTAVQITFKAIATNIDRCKTIACANLNQTLFLCIHIKYFYLCMPLELAILLDVTHFPSCGQSSPCPSKHRMSLRFWEVVNAFYNLLNTAHDGKLTQREVRLQFNLYLSSSRLRHDSARSPRALYRSLLSPSLARRPARRCPWCWAP